MKPYTNSLSLALDLDRQNQLPLHKTQAPPPEAVRHFSVTAVEEHPSAYVA
jgi:hypothetical protein